MFIIILTYVKPLADVDRLIEKHVEFLDEQYAKKTFIASGRKVPRTGGVIIANASTREGIEQTIQKDPFHIAGVASYEVIEFVPTKYSPAFKAFL